MGSASRSPNGTAISAPTRIASHTGIPMLKGSAESASRAAAKAPMPANVIWAREMIPPSPVTSVNEKKMIDEGDTHGEDVEPVGVEDHAARWRAAATRTSGPADALPAPARWERRRVSVHPARRRASVANASRRSPLDVKL